MMKKNIYKIDDLVQINGFLKSNTYRIANNITKNFLKKKKKFKKKKKKKKNY